VPEFNAALAAEAKDFRPDRLFFNGEERDAEEFDSVVSEYLPLRKRNRGCRAP